MTANDNLDAALRRCLAREHEFILILLDDEGGHILSFLEPSVCAARFVQALGAIKLVVDEGHTHPPHPPAPGPVGGYS